MAGDRTEKPTPKRLREARRDGRIARSPEIGAWTALLVAPYLLKIAAQRTYLLCQQLVLTIPDVAAHPDPKLALAAAHRALVGAVAAVLPLAGGLLLVGLLLSVAQGGVHPSLKALKPKTERLNPLKGVKRLVGVQGAWELAKVLLKTAVLALLAWHTVSAALPRLVGSGSVAPSEALTTTVTAAEGLVRTVALAALALALADYAFQRRRLGRSLRMTKHEVKEEHRQAEGDPQVRQAIRARQHALSRNRMISNVATADVVLVNPTHVAVALRYQPARGAPRVVAKGAGAVAARIRAEAEQHRVPVVQDVPLARAIYRACRLDEEIPPELYAAVAAVLAFLFSLRSRGRSTVGVFGSLAPAPASVLS